MNKKREHNVFLAMKEKLNYTTKVNNCMGCVYLERDMSTDNFGVGDRCGKNSDAKFSVIPSAVCDGFKGK